MVHLMHKNIKYTKFRMKGIPIDIKDLIKKKHSPLAKHWTNKHNRVKKNGVILSFKFLEREEF